MLKTYRLFLTALRALRRNVTRAVLTTLGIIIGIAAVIAMMEVGGGASRDIQQKIASMGANNLLLLPGAASSGGVSWGAGSGMSLTPLDCDAILRDCLSIKAAAPLVYARGQAVYGNINWIPASILGSTPLYLDVREWPVDQGAMFTDQDVRNATKVCLIGQTMQRELFEGANPVGKNLRLQNVSLKVIGVLSRKGANSFGSDQDDFILAPWTTIKYRVSGSFSNTSAGTTTTTSTVNTLNSLYPTAALTLYPAKSDVQAADTPQPVRFTNVNQILMAAQSTAAIPSAINEVTALMRERHRIHDDAPDDFNIRDMTEITGMFTAVTNRIGSLLLIVATISLIVGGVGIMNIMLVSVTERTREIGLRMAVGARGRDILLQFLVEAVLLCLAGGIIGIVIGRGSSYLVKNYLHFPTKTSLLAMLVAVAVSAFVGIAFGFYPAWKASRLDPIEALRYE